MKRQTKSSQNRGSVLRSLFAALLISSGIALLATAGITNQASAPAAVDSPQLAQAPASAPGVPRFANYYPPAGMGESAGEPSIGVNWKSEKKFSNSMFQIGNGGTCLYYGGLALAGTPLLRITFNDCSSPATALWEAKLPPLNQTPRAAGDPILFTDHDTGRTFISQLEGLTPAGSSTDITDDDGETFTPSEGSSLPSDLDHQTIGGGPFHAPLTSPLHPHAVYYASQSVADARAAVSLDGGVTFGPGSPMYTVNQCAGLHGHIKVSPKDGTVYVPNMGCGGAVPFHETGAKQAVIVSEDNGITWNIRPIPDSATHGNGAADNSIIGTRDPSVSIDADGNVYFVYQHEDDASGNTYAKVAVSHDRGLTWEPSVNVGATVINGAPILNATFVTATAGDAGRAAVAFFGTETGGNNWACGEGDDCSLSAQGVSTGINPRPKFTGVWYLYVSTTFDGGKTWTTQNVTPGDPIQRGGICGGGTCRNLLDFMDVQVDKQGRVVVGSEDGCVGPCVQGGANSFTAKAFISRQTGGKRMFAAFDPIEPALAGAPRVNAGIDAGKTTVQLTWDVPDDGGGTISGYKVYRRAGDTGSFTLIGTVAQTKFTDASFDPAQKNYYRVTALNTVGEGPYCGEVLPATIIVASPCTLPGVTVLTDPAGDIVVPIGVVSYPGLDLRSLSVAEPVASGNKMVFTLKVESLSTVPPSTRWPIQFHVASDPADVGRFVDMRTDATGAVSFKYGNFAITGGAYGNPGAPAGDADAESNFNADGTITIVVSRDKIGNPAAGGRLEGFLVRVRLDPAGLTPDNMGGGSGITPTGTYDVAGNASCIGNRAPTAQLVATPRHGNPPLTVAFNASTSVDPDAGDSVASYTFSFGDGSPDVTQSSPTISHTYKHGGGFFASLTVKDSKGLQSANVATVPIEVAAQLLNLSSRLRVQSGDNVLIGGLIIRGTEQKKVVLRGIGPSLNVPGKLEDPVIQVFNSANAPIATNDDWKADQQNVEATGLAPSHDKESALVMTLDPGLYTVVLSGKNGGGIGVVETYDIGLAANARLANLSSRGFIESGDNILIGGFFAGPQTAAVTRMVFRAIGPSLAAFGVPQPLQDPTIELRNGNGALIAMNDDWQTDQKAAIEATGLQPGDPREAVVVLTNFEPGPYTAIIRGKTGPGVGLAEIYDVQQ